MMVIIRETYTTPPQYWVKIVTHPTGMAQLYPLWAELYPTLKEARAMKRQLDKEFIK